MDSRSVAIPLLSGAGGALDHPASLCGSGPAQGERVADLARDVQVFTMTDPRVHDADLRVHDDRSERSPCRSRRSRWADLGVHDGTIRAFTMARRPHPTTQHQSRCVGSLSGRGFASLLLTQHHSWQISRPHLQADTAGSNPACDARYGTFALDGPR